MISRRFFVRHVLAAAALAGTSIIVFDTAAAQGNSGNGGGNGSGGGNGGGNSGNGGGGPGGGNGGGNGGNSGRGGGGNSGGAGRGSTGEVSVTHGNGMKEAIRRGRYEMRDVQGRSIVNRPATIADYLRLRLAR